MPAPPSALRSVQLSTVASTLLIPLVARARGGAWFPQWACADGHAIDALKQLDLPPAALAIDHATILNILWRTRHIRQAAQHFFAQHPQAWGVNLGCGLSHYFQWLNNGCNTWVDADQAEVIELRQALMPARPPRLRQSTLDLQHPHWWKRLALPKPALQQPLLMICEGVLMYLQPAQVQNVLAQFADNAPPGSLLLIDTMAQWAVGKAHLHPSVGPSNAQFQWGIERPQELTDMHPRLQLQKLHSVAECYGAMGWAWEALWSPWYQAPQYGVAELRTAPATGMTTDNQASSNRCGSQNGSNTAHRRTSAPHAATALHQRGAFGHTSP